MNDNYIKAVNYELEHRNYFKLDTIYKVYLDMEIHKAVPLLKKVFDTDFFHKDIICKAHNFINLWEALNQFFLYFEKADQLNILDKIKNIVVWNSTSSISIISIVEKFIEQNLFEETAIYKFYEEYLGQFFYQAEWNLERYSSKFIEVWFIYILKNEITLYMENIKDIYIDLTESIYQSFISILNEYEKKYSLYEFTYLLKHTALGTVYYLIEHNKLLYKHSQNFTNSFFENKLIQRIYINLDILEKELNSDHFQQIISNIDFNYKFYGSEMNKFIEKNNLESMKKHEFIDVLGFSKIQEVHQEPFLKITKPLQSARDVDLLIENLLASHEPKIIKDNESFKEFNSNGQIKEILNKFNTSYYWEESKEFIGNFIVKIFRDADLLSKYENMCIQLLSYGMENKFINNLDLIHEYLNVKRKNRNEEFSYEEADLLKSVIRNFNILEFKSLKEIIFSKIELHELSVESIFIDSKPIEGIDLNEFINTHLGRYCSIVDYFVENNRSNKENLKVIKEALTRNIQKCENPYKDYLKGKYIDFFGIENINAKSIYSFMGFCHYSRIGVNFKESILFREAALNLFTKNIGDSFIINNLTVVLLKHIDPLTESVLHLSYPETEHEDKNFKEQVLINIFEATYYIELEKLQIDLKVESWLKWYLMFYRATILYVEQLFYRFQKYPISIIEWLIDILEKSVLKDNPKIDEYTFLKIYKLEYYSKDQLEVLLRLIDVLFERNIVPIENSSVLEGIEKVLKKLVDENLLELADRLLEIIREKISKVHYNYLQNKYNLLSH